MLLLSALGLAVVEPRLLSRPLGASSVVHFGDLLLRTVPTIAQPIEEEEWRIERGTESVGNVAFKLSGNVASVKTFEIDIAHAPLEEVVSVSFDDDGEIAIEDEAEEVSRFVLAVLGSRLRRLDAERIEPEEVSPMIEVATEALACPGTHTPPSNHCAEPKARACGSLRNFLTAFTASQRTRRR